jgi:PAS domain S-box-containing protein
MADIRNSAQVNGGAESGPLLVERSCPGRLVLERAEELAQTASWDWDLETDELLWSDNMFRLLGLEPGEIVPTPAYVAGRIHPDDRERVQRELDSARQRGFLPDVSYRISWPDGTVHVLRSLSDAVVEGDGRPSRLVGSVQDVTVLSEALRQTAESLNLMETLQAAAPVGFAFVDRAFRIVRVNATLAEVSGRSPEELIGSTVAEVVPDVWSQMEAVYREVLETGKPVVNVEVQREAPSAGGQRFWLASYYPVRIDDQVIGVGIVVVDITEREEADRLRAAVMDTMVEGLYVLDGDGRLTLMNSAASQMLGWSERELLGKSVHAAIHFQHADGSPYPEADCALLKVRTEGRDVRMDHEAFTRKDGTICPVAYSAAPLRAGAERGVVVVFRDTSAENSEAGRRKRELDKIAWVGRIRDALDEDRMTLYSQPIVPLNGGEPSQELLLRMVGRSGEITPPGSFLPVAEQYGLIAEIDRWVVVQAIRIAARGERFEVNLSAATIGQLDLLPLIERELREAHTDPANIVFEITETALMQNIEAGEVLARGLCAIGCRLALDDFGTGFGCFTHLKRLPIAYLKVDVDFVRDLATNRDNQHLVKAIVGLAHDFGYETIAEGVEDAETLALVKEYGVNFAQGFHLGRPAPIDCTRSRSTNRPLSASIARGDAPLPSERGD